MSENISRIKNKTKNFSVMSNECFQQKDISARAKGIFGYLMTLPNDWEIHKNELFSHFSEGKEALNTAFKELEKKGYITSRRVKNGTKFAGTLYHIHEHSPLYNAHSFIEKYLVKYVFNGRDSVKELSDMSALYDYVQNKEEVSLRIKGMEYSDFLSTRYWCIIANNMKETFNKCSICGSSNDLNVHHTSYKNHGKEIKHLEDLQVLCRKCHQEVHGNSEEN